MRIMIHACPQRMWYVKGYLVPKLREQKIRLKDIEIWEDTSGLGNLKSCMKGFAWCGAHDSGATWHLQDDVLPAADFAERIKALEDSEAEVVCGFRGGRRDGGRRLRGNAYGGGMVKPEDMWWSFQCIRVRDKDAGECAEWYFAGAGSEGPLSRYRERGEGDDLFFKVFLMEKKPGVKILQVSPSMVDHISEQIGGSTQTHGYKAEAKRFPDHGEHADFEAWLEKKKGETVDR